MDDETKVPDTGEKPASEARVPETHGPPAAEQGVISGVTELEVRKQKPKRGRPPKTEKGQDIPGTRRDGSFEFYNTVKTAPMFWYIKG